MPETFSTRKRVEFRDTDAAGIMHFSVFFTYMEEAEHEFLRSLGASVKTETDDGVISWPRVAANCDFVRPVRFEDEFDIETSVEKIGKTSVTYGFRFQRQSVEFARGQITAVCCRVSPEHPPEPISIPADLASQLAKFHADQ